MRSKVGAIGVLLQIAFRNLFASKAKTFIVGGIILVGSLLVVVGSSIVDTIDRGMRGSIQGSLAGHLQVYNAKSEDDLALYGGMLGDSLLEPIPDFANLKRALEKVPNVASVVPMGINEAMISTGNEFDIVLEKLRALVRERLAGDPSEDLRARYESRKAHVRHMILLLQFELSQAAALVDEKMTRDRERDWSDLRRAGTDAFWAEFDRDPLAGLEFLENRIAPQSSGGGLTFIRYVGTDLDAYQKAFDRMQIVDGGPVPRGQRGILLGKLYAEEWLKMKIARRLDKIREALKETGARIADDEQLQRLVRANQGGTRDITFQLDPLQTELAARRLREALDSPEQDLNRLLIQLLTMDDDNFEQRYKIFYEQIAPLLQLYAVRVGDTLTIKAVSRAGYMNSVNVKVYGFVEYRGLEKSALAGIMSLLDLTSWRDLYGHLTPERAAEIEQIKREVAVREVSRENAEADLFGTATAVVEDRAAAIVEPEIVAKAKGDLSARVYSQQEIDQGVVLNAAITFRDPRQASQTLRDVKAALTSGGLDMKVVDWQKASGILGQFITLARIILYTAVGIIFAVALVIINNAMVMATLQRVKEIGTLRAIGAQKRFVLTMLLLETTAVGIAFGAAGTILGALVVWLIRARNGIPATSDAMYFFYSGPSLMPQLGTTSLAVSVAIVLLVSIASAIYPAVIATRVTPVEAMQSDD